MLKAFSSFDILLYKTRSRFQIIHYFLFSGMFKKGVLPPWRVCLNYFLFAFCELYTLTFLNIFFKLHTQETCLEWVFMELRLDLVWQPFRQACQASPRRNRQGASGRIGLICSGCNTIQSELCSLSLLSTVFHPYGLIGFAFSLQE